MELIIVLLTGLTTGGLTCLAVQGGLLASAVAARSEALEASSLTDVSGATRNQRRKARRAAVQTVTEHERSDAPVLAFLAGKLLAYTALGVLLGATGSLIGVSPTTRGWLQLLAGAYMVGTALNLLEVHPIFRYVVLQPPSFITRRIRRASKSSSAFAPGVLGLLTVLIPCGTTLGVEFFALSTGDPLYAGALMFAYTLGTMPLFYGLGRLTTQLSGERQARFLGFTAAAVLLLGLFSMNTAMRLLDYPLTYTEIEANLASLPERITGKRLTDPAQASAPPDSLSFIAPPGFNVVEAENGAGQQGEPAASSIVNGKQTLSIDVKRTSYSPGLLEAKAGLPIRLELKTEKITGCTRGFTIPSLGIQKTLPSTGTTVIEIPAQKPGKIRFTCSMGMYSGSIVVS